MLPKKEFPSPEYSQDSTKKRAEAPRQRTTANNAYKNALLYFPNESNMFFSCLWQLGELAAEGFRLGALGREA